MSARIPGAVRPGLMAAAVAMLVGCGTVGPDYKRPVVAVDRAFVGAGVQALNAQPTSAEIATFWRGFGDAQLTILVERAVAANGDVRLAQARLQEARASLDAAHAAAEPLAGVEGNAQRSVRPSTQQPGASRSARTGNSLDANFVASWELDLFGRLRRGSEAAQALTEAGQMGVAAAQTSVAAEVARNYLELRGWQDRLAVTQASLVNQREALRITQARVDLGRGVPLDLARARALVANTEALVPLQQNAVERSILRLATLSAQPPRMLLAELSAAKPLPGLPVTDLSRLPVGTPEQWLQRRPDVVAAERQLAAATAGIGIARSELYPRISLTGLLGLNAATVSGLVQGNALRYALGAAFSWAPLELGGVRARIRASEARTLQALVLFEQSVTNALEETEAAFSGFTRSAQRAERLTEAARNADEAARLARVRYEAGVTDFLVVLDAERDVLNQRDQLAQAQVGTATALVAVYRTLGGGWTPMPTAGLTAAPTAAQAAKR